MGTVLAECATHGVFETTSFFGGDGAATLIGNSVTCPACGALSSIFDGHYVVNGSRRLPTAYTPTPEARERLRELHAWATRELSSPAPDVEAVKQHLEQGIQRESTSLWAKVRSALRSGEVVGATAIVMLLLTVVGMMIKTDNGISADDLERILNDVRDDSVVEEQTEPQPRIDRMPSVPLPEPGSSSEEQSS